MKWNFFALMGGALFLPGACSPMAMPGDAVSPVELVSGETNNVQQGARFDVRLMGNPTTGYCWMVDNGQSLKHVKFVSERQETASRDPGLCGGPPHPFVFTFEAISPGCEKIIMVYKRSWEKKAPLEKRVFEVKVAG